MVYIKASLTGFVWVSLCMATISGVVIDANRNAPVVGAEVRLEKGGQTATSGTDGFFTLAVERTDIRPGDDKLLPNDPFARISGDHVIMAIEKKTGVEITAFDICGRSAFVVRKLLDAGNQNIALPRRGTGIYLYKVKMGDREFVLKGDAIDGVSHRVSTITGEISSKTLSKQGKAKTTIDEVIAVTKDGYLNYRCVIDYTVNEVVIKMIVNAGNVIDVDGNVYQSVRIGKQVWMAGNFRATRYNNGTAIPLDTSAVTWKNATTPKYCFYNNTTNTDSIRMYGSLYNWYVLDPANPRKIAPAGWHVPSDAEWDTLQNYLITNGYNWDSTTMGNKIAKSLAAKTNWHQDSTNGCPGNNLMMNNGSGFSALAGGCRFHNVGNFYGQSKYGYFWSATEHDASTASERGLYYNHDISGRYLNGKSGGYSVRLVKD